MLWMKAWLETRWRILYALGLPLAVLMFRARGGLASGENARTMMGMISFFSIFAVVYLASAGVRTQSAFRGMRGLHGSTYFTLSLPVSRLRLLGVRTGFGLLGAAGIDVIVLGLAWSIFPAVRGNSTVFDLLQLILTTVACTACWYFVSVCLSIFLEETWHLFGSLLVVGAAWWAVSKLSLPPAANIFGFMGDASPLITHKLPWDAIAISLLVSAIAYVAALRIVQTREY